MVGGQPGDVAEPLFAREDFHERAEVHDADDARRVGLAHLRLLYRLLHQALGAFRPFLAAAVDSNHSVVLDVHIGAAALGDRTDVGASRADHRSNLVDVDAHGDDLGRKVGHRTAGAVHGLPHDLEDLQAADACLVERFAQELRADSGDFDVHLKRRDALLGAGHLEVHVAQVVFLSQDIGQDHEAVTVGDQPHRDAGDRPRDRHAGAEQTQRAAAHGRHG